MSRIPELFASMVFNDAVMRDRLPREAYRALRQIIADGTPLTPDVANVVANAMKDWAVEKGATHFTHWFQPMTGVTAEKHDSFILPQPDGRILMDFSGKELIRGEPDASSFPSGGLRATFEARGYTAWDPSSYAFIKDGTLCIPTAFCAYSGQALDKKTPLLRSMQALDAAAVRVLRLLGDEATRHVTTTVGPEQEYFLIDKSVYEARADLQYCGRTLFGARPPKGQELDDHYFGSIKPRVTAFMKELDEELWKLGVLAKTEHNEVAPGQHELAPIFTTTNIAADHNQLTMELMKRIAAKHDLVCLLHEKPFAGVNGSGKHNNWSLSTDGGENLLEPGKTPSHNLRFLVFLAAILKAVDEHQDLLRICVATAGNDHRLGANEAPPAILSVFLGDELADVLDAIVNQTAYSDRKKEWMEVGAAVLPKIKKDTTDRNRTSPFAFTGNKFEFRMLGSAVSISGPNIVLNTIVADALREVAEVLEKGPCDEEAIGRLLKDWFTAHLRIVFNGNNYSQDWVEEAERRGLLNLKTTVEALPYFVRPENIALFERQSVFSETEIHSRYEILLENYSKTIHIEALTLAYIVKREIMASTLSYQKALADLATVKMALSVRSVPETGLLDKVAALSERMLSQLDALENSILATRQLESELDRACFYRESVFSKMQALRGTVDELETLIPGCYWKLPTYADMLYSVR